MGAYIGRISSDRFREMQEESVPYVGRFSGLAHRQRYSRTEVVYQSGTS